MGSSNLLASQEQKEYYNVDFDHNRQIQLYEKSWIYIYIHSFGIQYLLSKILKYIFNFQVIYLWPHRPTGQIYFDTDEVQTITSIYQLLLKHLLTNFKKNAKEFFPTDIKYGIEKQRPEPVKY